MRAPDRPAGDGAAVLDDAAARARRRYVLVTPAEKLDIEVEDAPFVAVEHEERGRRASAQPRLPPRHRRRRHRRRRSIRLALRHRPGAASLSRTSAPASTPAGRAPLYYELAELALAEGPRRRASGATAPFSRSSPQHDASPGAFARACARPRSQRRRSPATLSTERRAGASVQAAVLVAVTDRPSRPSS